MKEPGLLLRVLSATGSLLLRRPGRVVGGICVCMACSFVFANALWYQPGDHPSPFLRTRDPNHPDAIAGLRASRRPDPSNVTTFKIERAEEAEPQKPAALQQTAAAVIGDTAMVAEIQRELTRRGVYQGPTDGINSSSTEAAILFYEESAGLPMTGKPTRELLAMLHTPPPPKTAPAPAPAAASAPVQLAAPAPAPATRKEAVAAAPLPPAQDHPKQAVSAPTTGPVPAADGPARHAAAHVVPVSRPAGNLQAEDPVAAAIRAASKSAPPIPPADIPSVAKTKAVATPVKATPTSATTAAAASAAATAGPEADRIMKIQRGLVNIAYTDVTVDGVAGAQTKAAIRHFQKHYRLPETGEPDEAVLKKLKAIGAL
ncbi:peptidoglycan-binding domain-containing protein [Rhizobium oryzicola]|uniref:Peptidoglycan-binding domain-containing protein n=1 Tax=Rhizobium oryzicola TaxID=1232668 RepID=A0ABT8SSW2_9HYPH|nr:peptidoglycan-binding domain-containing protein [Rhizobium oryzicola]MDO1581503.1 peptidoglycan-binding domain-containing protein [Rhizobium oryzicola]